MSDQYIFNQVQLIALTMQTPANNKGARGIPIAIEGPPGTGKSRLIETIAEAVNAAPVKTLIGSLMDPTEVQGWPYRAGDELRYAPPHWLKDLQRAGRGTLFLDELSCAPPAVQAALLRGVYDRVFGDHELPMDVCIAAAYNPAETAAGGYDLAAALSNRFSHFRDWKGLQGEAWTEGLLKRKWSLGTNVPKLNLEKWEDNWGKASVLVGGFLQKNPGRLHVLPQDSTNYGGAWASQRSWEMAARVLASIFSKNYDLESENLLIQGCLEANVGTGISSEFITWMRYQDLQDPERVLSGQEKFQFDPERLDRLYVGLMGLAVASCRRGEGIGEKKSRERWEKAWQVVGMISKEAPDLAAQTAKYLLKEQPCTGSIPEDIIELVPILKKAGLLQ